MSSALLLEFGECDFCHEFEVYGFAEEVGFVGCDDAEEVVEFFSLSFGAEEVLPVLGVGRHFEVSYSFE